MPTTIFIEYHVKPDLIFQYKKTMPSIFNKTVNFAATLIDWYADETDHTKYYEVYEVPTHSHYYAFRRFRQMSNHPVFGELHHYLAGKYNYCVVQNRYCVTNVL